MAFDAARYRKRVLIPYSRRKLKIIQSALRELELDSDRALPSALDLVEFYDIPGDMAEEEFATHIAGVSTALADAERNPSLGGAGMNMLRLHQRIAERNPQLAERSFWLSLLQQQAPAEPAGTLKAAPERTAIPAASAHTASAPAANQPGTSSPAPAENLPARPAPRTDPEAQAATPAANPRTGDSFTTFTANPHTATAPAANQPGTNFPAPSEDMPAHPTAHTNPPGQTAPTTTNPRTGSSAAKPQAASTHETPNPNPQTNTPTASQPATNSPAPSEDPSARPAAHADPSAQPAPAENLPAHPSAHADPPARPQRPLSVAAELRAEEDGWAVHLSWRPGGEPHEDARYRIVRKIGGPPEDGWDGEIIGHALRSPEHIDRNPPIAATLHYGIVETRGAANASPLALTRITIAPPVREATVRTGPANAELSWIPHPAAQLIEVIQTDPDGRETLLPAYGQQAFADGLMTGHAYRYAITALYEDERSGEILRSPAVSLVGVPRDAARAAASFRTRCGDEAGEAFVEASWEAIMDYPVEVWSYEQHPSWRPGQRLPMEQIREHGTQVEGVFLEAEPGRHALRGPVPQGLRHYAPVTRDGEWGIVGEFRLDGICPPVSELRAERFGDEAVLSWQWPGPLFDAFVRWEGQDGPGERLVTVADYRRDGGCRISIGPGGGEFSVMAALGDGEARRSSQARTISVPPAAVPIRYEIDFQRRPLRRPREAVLRFTADAAPGPFEVTIIGAPGSVMPFDATRGDVLARATVTPSTEPASVPVTLPRAQGQMWVRAFSATPGVRLVDPSPATMKVK